jgi:hypothetical protein
MAQTIGLARITWRGQGLDVKAGAKAKIGGMKNNEVLLGRSVDRAQEFEVSEISATIGFRRGQSLKALFDTTEGALVIEGDNGVTYAWPDAFLVNRPEFTADGKGGEVELMWRGGEPEELING